MTGWGVIGILVVSELGRRYLSGARLGELIRQTWWYAALSLALFGAIVVASMGTSVIEGNVYYPGLGTWWDNFCLAAPFGHLAGLGWSWMQASGPSWAALVLNGVRLLFAGDAYRGVRWPLLIIPGVSPSVPFVASSGVRHMMIYGVMPTILSAIGTRALFRTPRAATIGVTPLLAALAPLSLSFRDRAYRCILPLETPYSLVADRLTVKGDEGSDPALGRATMRVEYPNGTVLLKLPPEAEPALGRADRRRPDPAPDLEADAQ